MSDFIIPADKRYRKQVIITLAIALPVCLGFFYGFKVYFLKIPAGSDIVGLVNRVQKTICWTSIANGIISAWLSTHLIFMSIKTFRSAQFPPAGVRVIWDTKIRTGNQAKLAGMLLIAAALIILSSNIALFFLHQTVNDLLRQITLH